MRKITEEDVVLYHQHTIFEASQLYGKGLEQEDRLMAASEAFLYAVRCYQKGISEFQPYAKKYMNQYILSEVREFNRIRRAESALSLDQPVRTGLNTESIGSAFFQVPGDFVNLVILRDFLNSLGTELKLIACLYIEDYSSEVIMRLRNITEIKLAGQKKRIQDLWLQYDS